MKNILIGCTGSVASIKLPLLISQLSDSRPDLWIKIIATEHATHFFNTKYIPHGVELLYDEDEWNSWRTRGDPILHIDLGKWADLLVIAPLDANTLAKIACGICDNLLTCTVRGWDFSKPLLFCPAMNTRMYDHPLTREQITKLRSWGYREVPCITKTLACGDTGAGAMAEVEAIVEHIFDNLGE